MLRKIKILNFQSHQDTELKLHPRINSIIGSSNQGKTAIIRALLWLLYNQPSGIAYVSSWNRDDEGNPKNETSICAETDNKKIKRIRTKKFNGYEIGDDLKLDALGKGVVPDEVKDIMRMTDVNIQKQLDTPFLVSASAGETARFFNRTIKLDKIDKMLSSVDGKKRKTKSDIKYLGEELLEIINDLESYDWVCAVEKLLKKADRIENLSSEATTDRDVIDTCIKDYHRSKEIIDAYDIDKLDKIIKQADEIILVSGVLTSRHETIKNSVESYNESMGIIKESSKILENEKLLKKYENIENEFDNKNEMADDMTTLVEKYKVNCEAVQEISAELEYLENELPSICPLCGNKIKELNNV